MRNTLIIMIKEPRPGRVKTRLGRDIGQTAAAQWFRHQSADLIRRLGRDPRWDLVLAVSPDHTGLSSRVWPTRIARIPQGGGDLGARMRRLLAAQAGPTVIIGADIPGIHPRHIALAFAVLGQNDVVFGPAGDGGYWLVGARRLGRPLAQGLFRNVRWSTPDAMADSIDSAGHSKIGLVDPLDDVDTGADLRRLRRYK